MSFCSQAYQTTEEIQHTQMLQGKSAMGEKTNETNLKPDGERFLPRFSGTIALEHYHRYFLARDIVTGRDVLDVACGEGYGSNLLAQVATSVVGVDIASEAVEHARMAYPANNLQFEQGSAVAIPLDDDSVDIVVSFETIEHLSEHDEMLTEIRRVLRPGGLLIISSPNKLVYSDRPGYVNPFHVRELYTQEFIALAKQHFELVAHYGQRVTTGSLIIAQTDNPVFASYQPTGRIEGFPDQMYDLILASDAALPTLANSVFEDPQSPLQPHKAEELLKTHEDLNIRCSTALTERDALTRERDALTRERDALTRERDALTRERDALTRECARLAADQESSRINADLIGERYELALKKYELALKKLSEDANTVLRDKWWRRMNGMRRLSNQIRRLKGKPPKVWPRRFRAEDYTFSAESGSPAISPIGGRYHPDIPTVAFSDIQDGFVSYSAAEPTQTNPRVIAFYLPQFHPFPENDEWWGKGFTEWTNVGKAKPLFRNHYQPHCPIHSGYYDLRVPQVMEDQAALAKNYGISGFAYYFYWFAGKTLMEQPLQQMLDNPAVDIPFCLIWANENWTRRWDGQENDVLIGQDHSAEDSQAFLKHLQPYFDDPRYIRVDGKPLLIIYRAEIIPDMEKTLSMWRAQAIDMGLAGLYIVCAQTFGQRDPRRYGFDAAMEFPPHTVRSADITNRLKLLDPQFSGSVMDYDQVVTNAVQQAPDAYKVLPTSMLGWDNTARKSVRGNVFANFSVTRYAQWLSANAERVVKDDRLSPDEKIIFVNAWNEWAEGTHLEPDQKHGYGYLEATRRVITNYARDSEQFTDPQYPYERTSNLAVVAHLHFRETWPDLRDAMLRLSKKAPDIYVTTTSLALASLIAQDFPQATIEIFDNRGRDIRPFLRVLRKILPLGYAAVCKVHGKISSYRSDGDTLRRMAFDALLTEDCAARMIKDSAPGLLVQADALIPHTEKNLTYSGAETDAVAQELGLGAWTGRFPAGSMFWFRPEALAPLATLDTHGFDIERGLADGTRAHAIERLFCSVCEAQGHRVGVI